MRNDTLQIQEYLQHLDDDYPSDEGSDTGNADYGNYTGEEAYHDDAGQYGHADQYADHGQYADAGYDGTGDYSADGQQADSLHADYQQAASGDEGQRPASIASVSGDTDAVPPVGDDEAYALAAMPGEAPAAAGGVGLGAIVSAGQLAWTIIKDSKPSGEIHSAHADAFPSGAGLDDLTGFVSGDRKLEFNYHWARAVINALGTKVRLALTWDYNGHFRGKGQYIANARVTVLERDLGIGDTVNADIQFGTPTNAGTAEAPIARLPYVITINANAPGETDTTTWTGEVHGNGYGFGTRSS